MFNVRVGDSCDVGKKNQKKSSVVRTPRLSYEKKKRRLLLVEFRGVRTFSSNSNAFRSLGPTSAMSSSPRSSSSLRYHEVNKKEVSTTYTQNKLFEKVG